MHIMYNMYTLCINVCINYSTCQKSTAFKACRLVPVINPLISFKSLLWNSFFVNWDICFSALYTKMAVGEK